MKTFVTGLALGALGYSLYAGMQRRTDLPGPSALKPEPLQRWEGEGGNVPAANTALKSARTDDLLAPAAQDEEPGASSLARKSGTAAG